MPSLFRIHDWPLTTKGTICALTTAAIPPCVMGALGMYQGMFTLSPYDRPLYLAGAVAMSALSLLVFRAFTQQTGRIAALITQLNLHASRSTTESGGEGGQTSDGGSGTMEKALSLSQAQEAHLMASTTTMHGLTSSIENMAEHIARSATVAEQAVTHAQSGSMVLNKTMLGIGYMRLQVQDTAKRLQHLETHACEVSEIGQRIAD
ncbi:MAG: hypothetical protein FJZ47_20660, partial [Candidatus Tectomicrobia bacterium]|nr:hypothetical protein [Candidatus Tectomicrobia bacterium]